MTERCARCEGELGATYWHLQGKHYCEACADFMRLRFRPATARQCPNPLILEEYGRGHAWFRR